MKWVHMHEKQRNMHNIMQQRKTQITELHAKDETMHGYFLQQHKLTLSNNLAELTKN